MNPPSTDERVESTPPTSAVLYRPLRESDLPYVLSTWLKNYAASRTAQQLERRIYFYEQKRVVERLLRDTTTIVAVNAEQPDQIFGWAVGEPPAPIAAGAHDAPRVAVIHYVFVKKDFRELGIGRDLVRQIRGGATTMFFTHLPPVHGSKSRVDPKRRVLEAPDVIRKLAPTAMFNPYLAFPR